jgi:hypothetical protein
MRVFHRLASRLRSYLLAPLLSKTPAVRPNGVAQLTLMLAWQNHAQNERRPRFRFAEVGFQEYSQFDEDGILLYVFALLGFGNRKSVEICAGDGRECNTANLILNHGFTGLLVDGNPDNVASARAFYAEQPATRYTPPVCVEMWITAENAAPLLESHGFAGDLDLLSIDLDGIDWWLWRALHNVRPRVVIVEFNHLWGPEVSVTVPYDPNFKAVFTEHGSDYAGASLAAFVKLGRTKGYRLVGTNRIGTNAVFVRDDLVHPRLPEVDPRDCFGHPRAEFGQRVRLPKVKEMAWEQV